MLEASGLDKGSGFGTYVGSCTNIQIQLQVKTAGRKKYTFPRFFVLFLLFHFLANILPFSLLLTKFFFLLFHL